MAVRRNQHNKLGVLVAGLCGFTGSTLATGLKAMEQGTIPFEAGVTSTHEWQRVNLRTASSIVVGGWDITLLTALERAKEYGVLSAEIVNQVRDPDNLLAPIPGVSLPSDFSLTPDNIASRKPQLQDSLTKLRQSIRTFKKQHDCKKVIVILLLPAEREFGTNSANTKKIDPVKAIKENLYETIRAGHLYALAAIMEGCAVVDFTASSTLESRPLQRLAVKNGVPLAGRDGSTGQTIMKANLGELFRQRGLKIVGWYSTNLIGNPDGLVLSHPEFQKIKMHDKLQPLSMVVGYPVSDHIVRIEYFPPRGDNKEAWDAIDLRVWTGATVQVKVNWLGRDSLVAAPLLVDLIRLIDHQNTWKNPGIVAQLGYFFKCPLGTNERGPSVLWRRLLRFYDAR